MSSPRRPFRIEYNFTDFAGAISRWHFSATAASLEGARKWLSTHAVEGRAWRVIEVATQDVHSGTFGWWRYGA